MDQSAFRAMLAAATVTRPVAGATSSLSSSSTTTTKGTSSTTKSSSSTTSTNKTKSYGGKRDQQHHWKEKDSHDQEDKYKNMRTNKSKDYDEYGNGTITDNKNIAGSSNSLTTAAAGSSTSSTNYRDRAYERRLNKAPTDDLEKISESLNYEQSKYLGGDISRTHLVKGLDFALLEKNRQELEKTMNNNNHNSNPTSTGNVLNKVTLASSASGIIMNRKENTSTLVSPSLAKHGKFLQIVHKVGNTLLPSSSSSSAPFFSSSQSPIPQQEQIQKIVAVLKNDYASPLLLHDNYNRFAPGRVSFEYNIDIHNYDQIISSNETNNNLPKIVLHGTLEVPKVPCTYTDDISNDLLMKIDRHFQPQGSGKSIQTTKSSKLGSSKHLSPSSHNQSMEMDFQKTDVRTDSVSNRSAKSLPVSTAVTTAADDDNDDDIFAGLDRYIPPTERNPSKIDTSSRSGTVNEVNNRASEDVKMEVVSQAVSPGTRTTAVENETLLPSEQIIEPTSRIRRSRWDDRTETNDNTGLSYGTEVLQERKELSNLMTTTVPSVVSAVSSTVISSHTPKPNQQPSVSSSVPSNVPPHGSNSLLTSYLQLDQDDILEMGSEGIDEWESMEHTETMAERKRREKEKEEYEYLHGKSSATVPVTTTTTTRNLPYSSANFIPPGTNIADLIAEKYKNSNDNKNIITNGGSNRAVSSSTMLLGGDREELSYVNKNTKPTGLSSIAMSSLGKWNRGGYGEEDDDDDNDEEDTRRKRKKHK